MDLDITDFYNNAVPQNYSASIAEIGEDAGTVTWRRACEDTSDYNLLDTDEKREEFRAYVKGFGAWTDEEIHKWSNTELNALCMQFIAGDIRDGPLANDSKNWEGYQEWVSEGQRSGNLFKGDDGRIYYYIGN